MADAVGTGPKPPKPVRGGRKDDGRPKNNLEAQREAEQAQLISILGSLRIQEGKKNVAKAAYDVEVATYTDIFRHAKAAGFTRKELEGYLAAQKSSTRDLAAAEERRARHHEMIGLPVGKQGTGDLLEDSERDTNQWEAEGYLTSLRNDPLVYPSGCTLAGHQQAFATGWHSGESKKQWAASHVAENSPAPPKPDAPKDPPPIADPSTPGPDDGFEATPEELAAQSGRPVRAQDAEESV